MPYPRAIIKKGFASLTALIVVLAFPMSTYALTSSTTCTAPSSTLPGVHTPQGSDASTFIYQCSGTYSGNWINAYYSYDPLTNTRTAIYPLDYTYNCKTNQWTMVSMDFDAATGLYVKDIIPATTVPSNLPTNCPVINSSNSTALPSTISTTATQSNTTPTNTNTSLSGDGITNNNINSTGNNNTTVNNGTTAIDNNNIGQYASSGNGTVIGNTSAGNASTGNVQDEANIINMLQSSSNSLGSGNKVITFTDNINGNVDGNLLLNPASLSAVQPASNNNSTSNLTNNLLVNNSTGELINNNINLAAQSGNATETSNTSGGNAKSGSAQAIANVVNLMNSAITSGKSFIGVININGNLNGNILIPANFVNELLADNVPTINLSLPSAPGSTNTTNTTASNNTTINNTNNQGISNKVNATANSGQASSYDNTSAGNATSGSASTHVTAFNLTGSKVIGSNDLLVFVNVLGKWVGLIMNAPSGTTAAEFGGGINTNSSNLSNSTDLKNTTNEQINNNINVGAQSGNATVDRNTKAGNATTGNANAAVNLLNIEGSSLSLSNWFGILFINVFGTWNGSLALDNGIGSPTSVTVVNPSQAASILNNAPTFGFSSLPASSNQTQNSSNAPSSITNSGNAVYPISGNNIPALSTGSGTGGSILVSKNINSLPSSSSSNMQKNSSARNLWKNFRYIGGLIVIYIVSDHLYSRRKRRLH